MSYDEELYTDIPPTKLRNQKEKFRKAQTHPFWCWLTDRFLFHFAEHRFYGMRIKNKLNFEKRNKNYANIFYAPHTNWWDGIVGYNLCKRCFKSSVRMMIEEMNRLPIFAKSGAFGINKQSPQESMKALRHAVDILNDPNVSLWLFPQGIIRPPNFRPIKFQSGMAYIAENVAKKWGGVNLIPVAVSYYFLREDQPEVLVDVGEPIILEANNINLKRKEFTAKLEKEFEQFCDAQLNDIHNGRIVGYDFLYRKKLPWFKKLEKRLKRIDMNTPTK